MITDYWYKPLNFFTFLLLPLTLIFGGIVSIRRFLYKKGFKTTYRASIPVIVVGNITVGGTGKTPLVIALAHELLEKGFYPGIISRGYKGKNTNRPQRAKKDSNVLEVGDEAVLIAQHVDCPIVVCKDRIFALKFLQQNFYCNIIISDDGLQHYRLGRDIEIAVIDSDRQFGNEYLLPIGPLREPISRLQTCDFIVYNNNHDQIPHEKPYASHKNIFHMQYKIDKLISVKDFTKSLDLDQLPDQTIHAIAGIGNPDRFFNTLKTLGLDIIEHVFCDHHAFKFSDIDFEKERIIIMTEKDAVKCRAFADERHWFLKVEAIFDKNLVDAIIKKIDKNHFF